ncbi:hypothetical protein VKT23_010378 [Stygiomarasmius scandens]|uniref:Uncharacterized protein n=1 Tax=Marasmiellus scandens TaxID=2682957 RepID=A0ABR1JC42_9AGAR
MISTKLSTLLQTFIGGAFREVPDQDIKGPLLLVNYHDDALPKPDAQISFSISNAFPGSQVVNLTHYHIDESHSNAYSAWLALGSPQNPTPKQLADLKAAGMLEMLHPPTEIQLEDGMVNFQFDLPVHAVSLLMIEQ